MQIKLYPVILLLCFLTLGFNTAYSQKSPVKFGKITKEHLEATSCPIDKEAHAYFIFDYRKVNFKLGTKASNNAAHTSNNKFKMHYKKHFRIKILDNQAFDWANIEIPLYHDDDKEKVSNLKGITYNLENGKVVKTKFNKKDIKTEETSPNWNTVKFAMPNVKAGSVIEVEYTVESYYYFKIPSLYFQHIIPSLYIECDVSTPEYLTYSQRETGYFPIERETDNRSKSVDITYSYVPRGQAVSQKSVYTVDYREDIFRYSAKNIPAFPIEKYLNTYENYIGKVDFELQSTNYPNQTMEIFSTTWEKVNTTMLENYEVFTLKKDRHLKGDAEVLLASNKEGVALMNLALQRVKKHFVWNGVSHKYSLSTLAKSYKDKSGNCADINLNLVMLLRQLGFASSPMILSTQKNGIIRENNPSVDDFNYVIAWVKYKGGFYLLDATDPYSEINLLPVRCLNGKGKVINQLGKDWVDLTNSNLYKTTANFELTLSDDLTIKGKGKVTLKGYAAYRQRAKVKKEKGNTKLDKNEEEEQDKNANLIIENLTRKGINTLGSDIELTYDITQKDYAEKNADLVYFSPALDPYFKENPFKLEKREFPVEFDYSSNIQQMYSITIPDMYEVSEIPKPLITQMPDKSIKFMYQVTQVGNKINVMSMLNIKKTLFTPEEYEGLKSVFQMMADKQKEFVVLKKK